MFCSTAQAAQYMCIFRRYILNTNCFPNVLGSWMFTTDTTDPGCYRDCYHRDVKTDNKDSQKWFGTNKKKMCLRMRWAKERKKEAGREVWEHIWTEPSSLTLPNKEARACF